MKNAFIFTLNASYKLIRELGDQMKSVTQINHNIKTFEFTLKSENKKKNKNDNTIWTYDTIKNVYKISFIAKYVYN